ncbi:MAG TPA: 23S rRNA (guanosine(2251)-2'-O)-methyltransferase RlmB [Chloroflexi bacterium]|nr:23S rRNA (guanosine(2251)-2'-O)-methyltransferase RlmB [Chloroflexota bacterium]
MRDRPEHRRRELLYGRHAVHESLQAQRRQHYKLILATGIRQTAAIDQICTLAQQAGLPVHQAPRQQLDQLGDVNHQGVALEAEEYPYASLNNILEIAQTRDEPPLLLLLDLLQDPQNVGSILRTAEAVGVHGAVIQRRRAVGITPAVVHASAGAVEHLPVAQVTNLSNTIRQLKEEHVWIAGLEAVPQALWYDQVRLDGPLAIVLGSEGRGLRRLVRERCDFLLQLPMCGRVTSLNASVAASVVLYQVLRQRRADPADR